MPDVFLSYSREDQPIARRFAEGLEREGFSVWWDQALKAGEAFDRVTEKALEEAKAVVVLWSKHSVESRWVRAEATQGHASNRLVPVMIEPCRRPILFELTHTADLEGWTGDAGDARWRSFVEGLRQLIGGSAPATRAETAPAATAAGARRTSRRWIGWAAAVAMLAIAGSAWYLRGRSVSAPTPAGSDASIAVLPFVNMSGDHDQEYFSDGLSEELINQLAHIDGLRVTARTSAFAFKGHAEDLRAVGKALGVAHILEGSVRRSRDTLRVTVQLIDVASGYHIWSETYDRKLDDVFAIQDEVAATVAGKLGATLGVAPRSADFGGTKSLEAYDHLLRGNLQDANDTDDGRRAAIAEYRRALAIDPGYARAAGNLAITLSALVTMAPDAALDREREQATQLALELAPQAPLSLAARMWLDADRGRWIDADAACATVLATARDPKAAWLCAGFLSVTGSVAAALPFREAGRAADPLSRDVADTMPRAYAFLDRGDELKREYERIHGLWGPDWNSERDLLLYLMHTGAPVAALADRAARACPDMRPECALWVKTLRAPGEAPAMLRKQLETLRNTFPLGAGPIALLAVYTGDRELALDALEVFSRTSSRAAFQLMWYPLLGEVRRDPRFKRIVRDIGWVDLWRKTGRWADACHPVGADDFECD